LLASGYPVNSAGVANGAEHMYITEHTISYREAKYVFSALSVRVRTFVRQRGSVF